MKSTEKMKISEAITKVENGFGSIYSKDDVLNLLSNLEINSGTNDITEEKIRDFCNRIKESIIENNDIVDTDNIELSIGYNNQIEIDDVPLSSSELDSIFEYEMNQFIDENFTIEDDDDEDKEDEDKEDEE
jgi:hypothetical protein